VKTGRGEAGQSLVLVAILLAFVLFAFLGFAVDLGRLYLIRGELNVAADAMALAAAQNLIGTSTSEGLAQTAASRLQDDTSGGDNRFNFGGNTIGGDSTLASQVEGLDLYATYTDAVAGDLGTTTDGSTARYVRVRVRADAPLTFWQFLPVAHSGKTSIETAAVAGISQPLCTACGIEPLAIVPVDFSDDTNFGLVRGLKYTLYSQCTGVAPPVLAGTSGAVQYTLLNRNIENSTDLDQQVFQLLAGGIPAPQVPVLDTSNLACPTIGVADLRLPTVSVAACNAVQRGSIVTDTVCGLNARLTATPHPFCEAITDVSGIISSYPPDTDVDNHDDYADYAGNRRRILTVAIVDNLPFTVGTTMNVLGFRQFLLEPNPNTTELDPTDPVGRIVAMYIGFPAPVKQGQFGSCGVTQGPGKVVLHQ
jgi:Flp pilus assembly protein TadG